MARYCFLLQVRPDLLDEYRAAARRRVAGHAARAARVRVAQLLDLRPAGRPARRLRRGRRPGRGPAGDGRDRGQRAMAGRHGPVLRRPRRRGRTSRSSCSTRSSTSTTSSPGSDPPGEPPMTALAPHRPRRSRAHRAAPDQGRPGRRRARRVLAAVPRPAAPAAASARRVSERMQALDCEVVDVGFISDAEDGARAAEQLRVAGCDLIVGFLTTYMTASMLAPIAQRSGAPVLLINLQPTESMDHATLRHRPVAGLLRRLPAAGDGEHVPAPGHRVPLGVRLPRGRAGVGQDRPLDHARPVCAAALRTAGTA